VPCQKSEAPAQPVVISPVIQSPGFTFDAIGRGKIGVAKERFFPSGFGDDDLAALTLEVLEQGRNPPCNPGNRLDRYLLVETIDRSIGRTGRRP